MLESWHFVYHRERCRTSKIGRRGSGIPRELGDLERRGGILVMLDLRFPIGISDGHRRVWSERTDLTTRSAHRNANRVAIE